MTAILVVVAYLLGSLPFGLWLARSEGVDLRATGSGNIGATNVLRTSGRLLATVVLALDSSKGLLAVWLARLLNGGIDVMVGCAVAVVIGHMCRSGRTFAEEKAWRLPRGRGRWSRRWRWCGRWSCSCRWWR
jgi:acyl-phosphate glycerol 3-phosphate acyltransferase